VLFTATASYLHAAAGGGKVQIGANLFPFGGHADAAGNTRCCGWISPIRPARRSAAYPIIAPLLRVAAVA